MCSSGHHSSTNSGFLLVISPNKSKVQILNMVCSDRRRYRKVAQQHYMHAKTQLDVISRQTMQMTKYTQCRIHCTSWKYWIFQANSGVAESEQPTSVKILLTSLISQRPDTKWHMVVKISTAVCGNTELQTQFCTYTDYVMNSDTWLSFLTCLGRPHLMECSCDDCIGRSYWKKIMASPPSL